MASEKKVRRLPVLQSGDGDAPAPSAIYVVLVAAAASLFAWTLVGALLNGLVSRALGGAGVVALANLVVVFASNAAGGALTVVLDRAAAPSRALYAGAVSAGVGWAVAFVFTVVARRPAIGELLTWLLILVVMEIVAALGALAGQRVARPA